MNKHPLIRKIYLYLFAIIGLVLITIGCVRLVGLALKTYIFTKADVYYEYPAAMPIIMPETKTTDTPQFIQPSEKEVNQYQKDQRSSQRQRDAAESLAMIIIGLPLYLYHWQIIKKEKESEKEND